MAKKKCPNCEYDISEQDLDETPHCPGCGANLKAKKYSRTDDPSNIKKELDDTKNRLKQLEDDNATIKKTLQEKEDEDANRNAKPRRTLFGS
jgi:flagellar motility protein MotE (MotC chaperone)